MKDERPEFLRAAAHQLKSPISIIQWCLQTALESKDLKGKDREMVLKAVRQADAMGRLTGELGSLFRLSDHSTPLSLVQVGLGSLVTKVVEQQMMAAEKAGVRLALGTMETKVMVMADEALLFQAIANLVDNAIKYSARDGSVEMKVGTHKGRAFVSVRDHGMGITPAEHGLIFKEFYRGAQARSQVPEGSGIGLALARRIAKEFGGDISLESQPGKGSTFTLELPLV